MGWQLSPYFYLLISSGVLSAALAGYVWTRRGAPGARTLAVLMAGVSVWALGYALESGAPGVGAKVLWAKVQYFGICTVPLAWLAFCVRYTGRDGWLTRRTLALLAVVPLVTLALAWTNGAHGLVWASTTSDASRAFPALVIGYGPWFFVYWIFSQALILTGTLFLLPTLARSLRLYRRQGVALLVGAAIPWIGNVAYVLGLVPVPGLDLTPFAFLLGGAALVLGLFGFRLLDLVPVARENVVEGMGDGVIVADPQDRVVDVNPAAEDILRRPAREAVGMTLAQLAPAWKAAFEEHRRAGGTIREEVKGHGGPEDRTYELTLSPVVDRKGRRKGRLVLLRDVTERQRGEEERARRTAELARSNAELEQFAHSVSHDLRAPLRSIDGFSRILLEDHAGELGGESLDHLRRVRASARRMSLLIDALLDLSRVTRVEMRRTEVDLSALAREVAGELRRRDPGRNARFEIRDGLTADGDARLLRVVLENLLDNAWKFTSREPGATIEFGADRSGGDGTTAYFVRDDGAGFDARYAGALFGPFQRLHEEDEFEGTGIGLATVARVVHRHGGRAWAEGETGRGATFFFTL